MALSMTTDPLVRLPDALARVDQQGKQSFVASSNIVSDGQIWKNAAHQRSLEQLNVEDVAVRENARDVTVMARW